MPHSLLTQFVRKHTQFSSLTVLIMMPIFNSADFDAFRSSYARALTLAVRHVKHPDAFRNKVFELTEEGDATQAFTEQPSDQARYFAWFLTDELDDKLDDIDWSLVHIQPNDDLGFGREVYKHICVLIRFSDVVEVSVRCAHHEGFARYMQELYSESC